MRFIFPKPRQSLYELDIDNILQYLQIKLNIFIYCQARAFDTFLLIS